MKMEQCSETSAYKIQTPGNCLEENIQNIIVFDYGVPPETGLGMSRNVRYTHRINFIQSEKILIPRHFWLKEFWIRNCVPVM
jgi:hypothetical protein